MATTGSGAQREGVGCIEAEEVVIRITEEMKQHLEERNEITDIKLTFAKLNML